MVFSAKRSTGRMERLTLIAIAVLSASLLLVSVLFIGSFADSYRKANQGGKTTAAMDRVLSGCLDFMFVRGRLNVVLSRAESINETDVQFLKERWQKASLTMHTGLSALLPLDPILATRMGLRWALVAAMKKNAEAEAMLPAAMRDPSIRVRWFSEASSFIEAAGDGISALSLKSLGDGVSFTYQRLLSLAVGYRDYLGSKASRITSLMERGGVPTIEELSSVLRIDGSLTELWNHLELYSASTGNQRVEIALLRVQELCFGSYYDNLEAAKHALMAGEPLPLDPKALAAQSVQALDSINGLLVTVFDEAMIHSKRLATNALGGLAIGLVILAWSIVVVILSPIMLRRSVFGPIGDVMAKLRVACDTRVSDEDGGNELMVLARTADRLIMEVREEQQKSRQMKQLADTDALTALLSRRAFMEQAAAKRKESGVLGRPWSMAMFDLDHFKTVNDRYGHAAGDQALVHFSSVLSKGLRASDLACRYGGEEFAVFLSDAGETKAMAVLERIRIALEQSSFVFSGTSISFTVSAGMYAARYDDQLELALNRADHALYEAKAAGRNKTIAWKHVG